MEAQERPESASSASSSSSGSGESSSEISQSDPSTSMSSLASSQFVSVNAAVPNRAVLPPDIEYYMHEMQSRFRSMPRATPVRYPYKNITP